MAAKAPRLNEMVVTRPASLARVQEMLGRDQCDLLYYLVFNERVIVWHIGPEVVRAKSVFLTQNELKKKVAALREGLKSRDAAANTTAARELFLFLVQPVVDGIKQRHVILIPHDELHYLPFAALIDPQGRAMGERFALSDAPNAGILLDLSKGSVPANSRVLAAADPEIEEARTEVTAIAELYPGRGKSVIDPLITESEVKASAANYEVLHLSVHGKFSPMEPMLSYLQLGKDGRDDGRLTAAEMFGLPLGKAKLVVLSACETGQATATPGNEILGIERALLYAGANNLVLSGWPVDAASTALWMKIFHRAAQNEPLAEAARLALLEVKQKFPHPYHWAAFRLVGK
jgi:CHAT domain-containing protein